MRFMMIMLPNADAAAGKLPDPEFFAAMMKYNEELQKAGMLLALEGLHPSSTGARVSFRAGKRTVADGPFAEAKEAVGGFWLIQAKSKAEAVEWAKRCPAAEGDVIEIRQVQEMSDFSPEIIEATKDSAAVISEHLGQHKPR
jgi:hypothetical protein